MIEFIFTIDYEIYGNGHGSLNELVFDPAKRLKSIFNKWNARFVTFVEVAELEMIEIQGTNPAINPVKNQIQEFYREGFELGLHLHPQWYNAKYENGKWLLDYNEYNLCTLARERIVQIVDRAIVYLRGVLGMDDFMPISFRAGNWLFQPTRTAAGVLAEKGIKIDSSVFKGGLQHMLGLDYRPSIKNGHYWKFLDDVNNPDSNGALLELPIFTQMVAVWKMATAKRINLEQKAIKPIQTTKNHYQQRRLNRLKDFLRIRYPLKLDFCRMTIVELIRMMDKLIKEDRKDPTSFKPIVAIGHTKDLIDFETVESFLSYLKQNKIPVVTFRDIYQKCIS